MTNLGPCRHRYGHGDYCGVTLLLTPYGPGHSGRPRVSHYALPTSSGTPLFPEIGAPLAAGLNSPISIDPPVIAGEGFGG